MPERYRPIGYLTQLVRRRTSDRVRCGPFASMHYSAGAIGSAYLPKLLGCYERELTTVVEAVCSERPKLIVDIGAAEGYYAVGLARRNPQARVIAFEQNPAGRIALERMCWLNGVHDRVDVRGHCSPADLEPALQGGLEPSPHNGKGPFVLCDVEGDEGFLLDPKAVPGLKSAWLLVETHDFIHPGITELLQARFAATHLVQQIWQEPRLGAEFPFQSIGTAMLPKSYLDWAVSEWRPVRMSWLWMKPHG
ncbi:MAG TPA: hypothetical protein VFE51_15090 [Verrucomicrobiae bacterium]|nr:hypothetical protein [Verrucomicrobiae bacterium]